MSDTCLYPPDWNPSNAIHCPSGDHAGSSSDGPVVSGVGFVPSAFMSQIDEVPCAQLWNAIFVPSDDHAGWPEHEPVAISCSPVPSALTTSMAEPSAVELSKAIIVPSGDQEGSFAIVPGA